MLTAAQIVRAAPTALSSCERVASSADSRQFAILSRNRGWAHGCIRTVSENIRSLRNFALTRATHSIVREPAVSPMRVLIIDDDDIARELLSSTLRKVGHDVFEMPSAIGATRAIFENDVDAVVVDVMMPDICGDKLARVLRQGSRGATLAIVLVSSRPLEELRSLARSTQADGVVTKSEVRSLLGPSVSDACARRGRALRAR